MIQNNFTLLQKYLALQTNVTLDQVIEMGYAKIGYSSIETSTYENFALTNKLLSEEELLQMEQTFRKRNRKSAVYFENKQALQQLAELFIKNGYKRDREDSWMFHDGNNIHVDSVKKVVTEDELAVFLKTFDESFQKDDPQNAIGVLGDYLKITQLAWQKHHATNRLEYFIAFKGGKPVATSTLNNFDGIGFISNVGSLRQVRGEGYGKRVTLHAVNTSVKNGNVFHCLTTVERTYPNEFYKRIGFQTKFTAVCYASQ